MLASPIGQVLSSIAASWSCATVLATITPAALRHGPGPMRSAALTVDVLRYARQLLAPSAGDTAVASCVQKPSAPVRPFKLPPFPMPRLVTKKLIVVLPPPPPPAPSVPPAPPPEPPFVPAAPPAAPP